MFEKKQDSAAGNELAGEELSEEQLSHVSGAAQLLAGPQAIQLVRQRLPVVNPQNMRSPVRGFNFDEIPPDLEDPWPKGPPEPPPEDPPIPPDLENPWPSPPPPADFPSPFGH